MPKPLELTMIQYRSLRVGFPPNPSSAVTMFSLPNCTTSLRLRIRPGRSLAASLSLTCLTTSCRRGGQHGLVNHLELSQYTPSSTPKALRLRRPVMNVPARPVPDWKRCARAQEALRRLGSSPQYPMPLILHLSSTVSLLYHQSSLPCPLVVQDSDLPDQPCPLHHK